MSAISQAHVPCAQVRRRQRILVLKCGIADVSVGEVCRANGGPELKGVRELGVQGGNRGWCVRGLGCTEWVLLTGTMLSSADRLFPSLGPRGADALADGSRSS